MGKKLVKRVPWFKICYLCLNLNLGIGVELGLGLHGFRFVICVSI